MTSPFPQITSPPQAQAEVIVNEALETLGPFAVYGKDHALTSGLARGYYGGRWGGFAVTATAHTFGASTTTYVSVKRSDGSLDFSTTSSNYDDAGNYARVEMVVTDAAAVSAVTDDRAGPGGVHGGGGSAVPGGIPATTQTGEMFCGYVATPAEKTYKFVLKAAHAGTITETTTISESGTCTATFKINTTALGGAANSVSSTEQSQAQASANAFSAGDDIQLTISSNSTCLGLSFTIKYSRDLS